MRLVPVQNLKENSQIAINIIDNEGRFMLKEGQKITSQGIQILNRLGVSYVYINDEYCFHQGSKKYSSKIEGIYEHIITLREIGTRIINGTSGATDVTEATSVASKIVDEILLLPKDFKISYEPNKLIANSLIEQTIYVAMMSTALGIKMELPKDQLVKLCLAALLKDVALLSPKIKIDNHAAYRTHPQVAYDYLKAMYDLNEDILKGVLQHHELFDGSGFPNQTKGSQICTFARIISLVDCFYEIKSKHAFLDSTEMLFETRLKQILLKFDAEMITYFIRNAEVFTLDTLIRLNNDDIAVVYENNSTNPFKPVVKIIRSNTYDEGELINLHESHLVIKRIEYYVEG
ncbi:MAG: hypothetical protein J6F30_02165 [Cellulosilyticum sp.]|nr:hypothetical protein [Cellulosilyticum sp.]